MKQFAAVLCIALQPTVISAQPAKQPVDESPSVVLHYRSLLRFFKQDGLLPILVNRGQRVGWVFDTNQMRYIDKGECFPNLPQPVPQMQVSNLAIFNANGIDLGASIGVVSAGVNGQLAQTKIAQIEFSDIQVYYASDREFRKYYDKKICPELQSMFSSTPTNETTPNRYLVLGEIWFARPKFYLQDSIGGSAEASSKITPGFLKSVGLELGISAKVAGRKVSVTVLESEKAIPVAARPALLQERRGILMGSSGEPSADFKYRSRPFTPKALPTQMETFAGLIAESMDKVSLESLDLK